MSSLSYNFFLLIDFGKSFYSRCFRGFYFFHFRSRIWAWLLFSSVILSNLFTTLFGILYLQLIFPSINVQKQTKMHVRLKFAPACSLFSICWTSGRTMTRFARSLSGPVHLLVYYLKMATDEDEITAADRSKIKAVISFYFMSNSVRLGWVGWF